MWWASMSVPAQAFPNTQTAGGSPVLVVLFDDLKHSFCICILTLPW